MEFSLFYFACDDGVASNDKYQLLIEGARFADQNDFCAVWTPERHFHSFGGLYPNPSVTSAALAMVTERIQLRAGSVVLPLHNPLRVAEEWSLVDNLSKGRVAVSLASGWHANDFVFAPEKYSDRRRTFRQQIELLRKLWRGESLASLNGAGEVVEVKIFPRPIQRDLPIWITASGNHETFRLAGVLGANVLTHLLGQTIEELAAKIAIYREAWLDADHRSGTGRVTLMLHTFVGEDIKSVQENARGPFLHYLRTSTNLNRTTRGEVRASDRGSQNQARAPENGEPSERDLEAITQYASERFLSERGLLGTPDSCLEMLEQLEAIGVDEVACLIDFGIETELVLHHLRFLDELRKRSNPNNTAIDSSGPIAVAVR